MAKFYAVRVGHQPGIYTTWEDCQKQVKGFSKAEFKSFPSLEEAKAFLNGEEQTKQSFQPNLPYAFVDGSYNAQTGAYGWGGFFVTEDHQRHILQGSGKNPQFAEMRNVAGEIVGALSAVDFAIKHNIRKFYLYYDYSGIEMWATGKWKANKEVTQKYASIMQNSINSGLQIVFQKVTGHTGIPGNEYADLLAKQSVGIEIEIDKMEELSRSL